MLNAVAHDIRGLQGGGGEPFTAFVDALIRAHAATHGLLDAVIDTTVRVNIPDGGVDTSVREAIAGDPVGWLAPTPTAWQYKGTEYRNVAKEIPMMLNGAAVRERIAAGDAFRLAIADSPPGRTRRTWEAKLTAHARAINPAAPDARVVTADDLAAWASRYPALVLSVFHAPLTGNVLHLEAWAKNARQATDHFVPVEQWAVAVQSLSTHVDLTRPTERAVRPLQGEAGVGKTRLAFEVVSRLAGAQGLVLYCNDDDASLRVATTLANTPQVRAILVADECGIENRLRLEGVLGGHRDRVRVVAIDNTGERPAGAQAELVLGKMPNETLTAVLDENFPGVPPERRRAYASLAEGFPRLAADLCVFDPRIAHAGGIGPAIPTVDDFIRARMSLLQRESLAALAFVTKVGYTGDVRNELDSLCSTLDLDRRVVERALREIHDGPGFVARAGRYYYVTPELVAQVANEDAWRRWGELPAELLGRLPEEMIQSVLDRAWRSAPEEVRRACANYFRDWANAATPEQLRDVAAVRRFVALTDTRPDEFLPRVRRLVESAPAEVLLDVHGGGLGDGTWGPRRTLVWLAERLAQFPEFFDDAERVLLRLAVAESEPGIANNATGIWRQLYRVYLSGTAVPFTERLDRLRTRLQADDPVIRMLAASALDGLFDSTPSRMLGPAVVAGRIPPPDWRPETTQQARAAYASAVELLQQAVLFSADLRVAVVRTVVRHARSLIMRGYAHAIRALLDGITLEDDELAALVEAIDAALAYDFGPERRPQPRRAQARWRATRNEVAEWRGALAGRDLHARLVATVGKDRWAASRVHAEIRTRGATSRTRSDPFQRDLDELARTLASDPAGLNRELPWLTSHAALSAGELGEALGRRDAKGALIDTVVGATAQATSYAFPRGYIHGLLTAHPTLAAAIVRRLETLDERDAVAGAELAIGGGETVGAIDRVIRLFDDGRLTAIYLADRNFTSGEAGELPPDRWSPLLERLAGAAEGGDELAERIGIDSLAMRLPFATPNEAPLLFAHHPEVVALAWRLVEARALGSPPASRWWRQVVVALGWTDGQRAIRLAAALLASPELGVREEGAAVLIALAPRYPLEVMDALGGAMLDERTGWRFFLGDAGTLVQSLPESVVQDWLERAGVPGAQRVARHLPEPHLDEKGEPVVPALTAWVLETFERDDRTFHEFCAGVHNFQVYSGDIAAQHEEEARVASRFLDHPLRRIREWAESEMRSAAAEAERARQWQAEIDLP